jgi:nucleotide-binding universal stress UspA family protein
MSGEEIRIKKILFAIDGSDPSLKAAKYAVRIAKFERASIICIHVIPKPQYLADHPQESSVLSYYGLGKKLAGAWFRKAIELASKEGIPMKTDIIVDAASIPDAIINYAANESVDLIILGTRGSTGLKRFPLGSVANAVVTHAMGPVLVVR